MKTIILHGQNTIKSYERLTRFIDEARKRDWEILYDEVSSTPSLFGKERLIIIRNLNILTKTAVKSLDKINGTLILYSQDDLPQTTLKLFSSAKIEKYEISKTIWSFLDHPAIEGLHQLVANEPVEFVFALFAKRIRDLLYPPLHYQSWQIGKLKAQKAKYSDETIKEMIDELAQIDLDAKTGKRDLTSSLDLFIVKNLQ
jgi:DNA polymerase III delta subunit